MSAESKMNASFNFNILLFSVCFMFCFVVVFFLFFIFNKTKTIKAKHYGGELLRKHQQKSRKLP